MLLKKKTNQNNPNIEQKGKYYLENNLKLLRRAVPLNCFRLSESRMIGRLVLSEF